MEISKRSEKFGDDRGTHNFGDAQFWEVPKPAFSLYLPEPKPEPVPEPEEEPKEPKKVSWQKLKQIRNKPVNVKLIDVETGEIKVYPSIYKASQYLDKSPQTIRHYGQRKGVWNKKYQIIINEEKE